MASVEISQKSKIIYEQCVREYYQWFLEHIFRPVNKTLGTEPLELSTALSDLVDLIHKFSTASVLEGISTDITITETETSYLKRAILFALQAITTDIETKKGFTNDPKQKELLEEEIKKVADLAEYEWFEKSTPFKSPKLTGYLTIEQAEQILKRLGELDFPDRVFDEKFHILNVSNLFWKDIKYYRSACYLRACPLTIAYLDIDDFKDFNTEHNEAKVDRDVLPVFMRTLEAHVFSHGHAYRFGGDEYVMLLPNMSSYQAGRFLKELQGKLVRVEYSKVSSKPSVSIGISEINESTSATDWECFTMANIAKNKAKEAPKGRIVINTGFRIANDSFEDCSG